MVTGYNQFYKSKNTTAMSAALGGTISSLSGGSFTSLRLFKRCYSIAPKLAKSKNAFCQNGAMTAAFANLYNDRGQGHDEDWHDRDGLNKTHGHYGSSGNACGTKLAQDCHLPPTDPEDALYRQHDIDYGTRKWSLGWHSDPVRNEADVNLVNRLSKVPVYSSPAFRRGVNFLFDGKFYVEDHYP